MDKNSNHDFDKNSINFDTNGDIRNNRNLTAEFFFYVIKRLT